MWGRLEEDVCVCVCWCAREGGLKVREIFLIYDFIPLLI